MARDSYSRRNACCTASSASSRRPSRRRATAKARRSNRCTSAANALRSPRWASRKTASSLAGTHASGCSRSGHAEILTWVGSRAAPHGHRSAGPPSSEGYTEQEGNGVNGNRCPTLPPCARGASSGHAPGSEPICCAQSRGGDPAVSNEGGVPAAPPSGSSGTLRRRAPSAPAFSGAGFGSSRGGCTLCEDPPKRPRPGFPCGSRLGRQL